MLLRPSDYVSVYVDLRLVCSDSDNTYFTTNFFIEVFSVKAQEATSYVSQCRYIHVCILTYRAVFNLNLGFCILRTDYLDCFYILNLSILISGNWPFQSSLLFGCSLFLLITCEALPSNSLLFYYSHLVSIPVPAYTSCLNYDETGWWGLLVVIISRFNLVHTVDTVLQ